MAAKTDKEKFNEITRFINKLDPSPDLLLLVAVSCIKTVGLDKFKEVFASVRPDLAAEMEMAIGVTKNRN